MILDCAVCCCLQSYVDAYVPYLYDATSIWAILINKTLERNEDPRNGTYLFHLAQGIETDGDCRLYLCLSVPVFGVLSFLVSVCLSVSLCLICLFVSLSFCLCPSLSLCLCLCLSVCLSVSLPSPLCPFFLPRASCSLLFFTHARYLLLHLYFFHSTCVRSLQSMNFSSSLFFFFVLAFFFFNLIVAVGFFFVLTCLLMM